jgi:integrase/recombinase XerD
MNLVDEQQRSHSYVNAAVSASKFFLKHVVKKGHITVDLPRMVIHIKQGKGRKDRYTVLSEVTLKKPS